MQSLKGSRTNLYLYAGVNSALEFTVKISDGFLQLHVPGRFKLASHSFCPLSEIYSVHTHLVLFLDPSFLADLGSSWGERREMCMLRKAVIEAHPLSTCLVCLEVIQGKVLFLSLQCPQLDQDDAGPSAECFCWRNSRTAEVHQKPV